MTILITRPNYDDATSYLFYYTSIIIEDAREDGFTIIDLKRPNLTPKNFEKILKKKNPSLIFFNAHGNEKIIYGDKIKGKEMILVEEGKNHQILDSKIVYARACWTAASLGKACKGGCFIGYKVPFSFWINENWSAKPSNDNTAKLFIEPSDLIIRSLLKGNSAKEAVNKSLEMSKKNILNLLKKKEESGVMASIMILWNNMQGLDIIGDKNMNYKKEDHL